ncbi:MAG: phosphoribosyl-AMP cyclohydrolase, partial [Phycisphaeraceae bacterium]|nr:phosphoribosyl-AMP cyclohydrolase [Phycisphaeraceae bacterium]
MCQSSDIQFAPRGEKALLEEGNLFAPKFDDKGLITAIAQDHVTGKILMVAFMNQVALKKTIELGEAVYFSRSRQKLWHKGEESGNTQKIKAIYTDCDQDALVLEVEQVGNAACHVGYNSCFYRKIDGKIDNTVALTTTESEKVFDPKKVY